MRKIHWLIIFIIALYPLVGVAFYPFMPERMGTHWSGGNVPDGYMSKFSGTFVTMIVLMIITTIILFFNIIYSNLLGKNKTVQLIDFLTLPGCIFLLVTQIAVFSWNAGADFSVPKFMLVGGVIMIASMMAGIIYVLTRKTEIPETINSGIKYVSSEGEYKDKLIEISGDEIVFKNYYFPIGSKRVKLSEVEHLEEKQPTLSNGKWRLHGTGDLLFRIWFPADYNRPSRDKIFMMKIKDKWTRIGFTVENSYAVSQLFRTRGLL